MAKEILFDENVWRKLEAGVDKGHVDIMWF